jgi:enediyne biosynthesis protein E5
MSPQGQWAAATRLGGLRRFAVAITVLNVLGHTVLGFEQSWAQPLVALATAYGLELLLEAVEARAHRRRPQFRGGLRPLVDFLLSAHITGLAVAMLLYANERLLPVAFAAAVAVGSKALLRAPTPTGSRHVMNPSNFGITVTLLAFPWVGIAPPYHFTENVSGALDWLLPALIVVSGTFINARFTGRLPLVAAWLGAFVAQAALRSLVFGTPLAAALLPMTGLAFVLYTFYMVTDPATTPSGAREQVVFGAGVAGVYGLLMVVHVVFGLFFALSIVCAVRGMVLHAAVLLAQRQRVGVFGGAPALVRERRS